MWDVLYIGVKTPTSGLAVTVSVASVLMKEGLLPIVHDVNSSGQLGKDVVVDSELSPGCQPFSQALPNLPWLLWRLALGGHGDCTGGVI